MSWLNLRNPPPYCVMCLDRHGHSTVTAWSQHGHSTVTARSQRSYSTATAVLREVPGQEVAIQHDEKGGGGGGERAIKKDGGGGEAEAATEAERWRRYGGDGRDIGSDIDIVGSERER